MSEEIDEAIIEEATKGGWRPVEEWDGDPDKWRSAEEFVERGNAILPIVKKRMSGEIDRLKKDLETTLKYQSQQLDKITKQAEERAKREYEEKLASLTQKEMEAVQDGDTEEFKRIKAEREKIKPPEEQLPAEKHPKDDPVFDNWKKENEWYDSDETATLLAMSYAQKLKESQPETPYDEFLNAVGDFVKKELPHKFVNQNREKPGVTDGPGHSDKTSRGKSYKDLPSEAKLACKRSEQMFKEKGLKFDRESWVKIYFEEE